MPTLTLCRGWQSCIAVALVCLSGCILFGNAEKPLVGDYRLARSEDGRAYYIYEGDKGETLRGGGALDGTVKKVGWSANFILAWRSPIVDVDRAGWMIIDIHARHITGPLSDEELLKSFTDLPELKTINVVDSDEAWRRR